MAGIAVSNPVFCVCCVDSGLCDEVTTCAEEYSTMCICLIVLGLETLRVRRPRPDWGCCPAKKKSGNALKCFVQPLDVK